MFFHKLCGLFNYTNELIKEHNARVIGSTVEGDKGEESNVRKNILIPLLKEEAINCSCCTVVNSKSDLLNYTEKGAFSN